MKCPKCSTETPQDALCCPRCKLVTPKGRFYAQNKEARKSEHQTRALKKAKSERGSKPIGPVLIAVAVVSSVIIFGLGSYIALIYWEETTASADNPAHLALEKVRRLPSSREGLSVEDFLKEEVEKARNSDLLLESEGWDVKPVEGAKFIVAFTFQLKDKQQRAEWAVDIAENTFVPKTDLAAAVYKKK